MLDNQAFTIAAPVPSYNEFVTYKPSLPLHDDALFLKSNYVTGLKVHWTYRTGLIRKVAGVLEVRVMLQAARQNNVTSEEGLKQEIFVDFKQELAKVGYKGTPIQFENMTINGRSWLKYQVPVLGVPNYSTALSGTRFLTAGFDFIDATGEKSPAWHQEANELMKQLVASMRVE